MEVLSRAWRTDLALLALAGSVVEHHPTHVIVRTPDLPGYRWGNFVLLRRRPLARDLPRVVERFADAFPGSEHQAFGIDDPLGCPEDLAGFEELGFQIDAAAVLTAEEVHPPPRPNGRVRIRPLDDDADWARRVSLSLACSWTEQGEAYADHARAQAAAERELAETGRGTWFGAFDGPALLATVGVVRTGAGMARFQQVETHPEARRRGLGGTLAYAAGSHALRESMVSTLVIVADPGHKAISVYVAVGFTRTETRLRAERG